MVEVVVGFVFLGHRHKTGKREIVHERDHSFDSNKFYLLASICNASVIRDCEKIHSPTCSLTVHVHDKPLKPVVCLLIQFNTTKISNVGESKISY